MRATFTRPAIAIFAFLAVAACSDQRNEPLAPRAVDTHPNRAQCTTTISSSISGGCYVATVHPLVAIDVSAGDGVTCAVDQTGKAFCWGDNSNGMLGTGAYATTEQCQDMWGYTHYCSTKPVPVIGAYFTAISVGETHVCGIQSGTGYAYCWGNNAYGQLGFQGNYIYDAKYPVQPPTGASTPLVFASISAGNGATCGVTTSQLAYCWGAGYGVVPVLVGSGYRSMTANSAGSCYLTIWGGICRYATYSTDFLAQGSTARHFCRTFNGAAGNGYGNTECWGSDSYGQLGNGQAGSSASTSPSVIPNFDFQFVATGAVHTCGIQYYTGDVYCWGDNLYTEIGDEYFNSLDTRPYRKAVVPSGVTFTRIAAGFMHTCAIDNVQKIWCWGKDDMGQIGVGYSRTWLAGSTLEQWVGAVNGPVQVLNPVY